MTAVQLLLLLWAFVSSRVSASYPFPGAAMSLTRGPVACASQDRPCRMRAMVRAANGTVISVNSVHQCSCPLSRGCSEDWTGATDYVITRQLRTEGHIMMTLSLMFCQPVQPKRRCNFEEVAVQLVGQGLLPNSVDFVSCRCADPRPLLLHSKFTGRDYLNHHSYVCFDHKRRCNVRRRNRENCMVRDDSSAVSYPCKCPSRYSCSTGTMEVFQPRAIGCRRLHTLSNRT